MLIDLPLCSLSLSLAIRFVNFCLLFLLTPQSFAGVLRLAPFWHCGEENDGTGGSVDSLAIIQILLYIKSLNIYIKIMYYLQIHLFAKANQYH